MARGIGRIEERVEASGRRTFRIVVQWEGRRWRIGSAPIGGRWRTIDSKELADFVLADIRAAASSGGSVERAVAPFLRLPDDSALVLRWLDRFIERERARCAAGEISPRTLGELERQQRAGNFAFWEGHHIFSLTYGDLEDWHAQLAADGRGPVIRARILENMRRLVRWLARRGEIDFVPEFPRVAHDRKAPEIYTAEEQGQLLASVPWERRGIFLAMAHTLRPGEARAADLWHWLEPDILVQAAAKGKSADATIRGLKERDWRVVGADNGLCEWIRWRLEQASAEERLRRRGVPLFPNAETGGRWSHQALDRELRRAAKRAGLRHVPLYAATKHTTATDLIRRGVNPKELQRFLGHADQRSTDAYIVLAGADVKDLVRGRNA